MVEVDGWRSVRKDISLRSAKKQGGKIANYSLDIINSAINQCVMKRVALDVGAHIGIVANQLSKVFRYVHAFEIDNDIRPHLIYNLQRKGVTNITVHNFGLGDRNAGVNIHKSNKSFSTHVIHESTGIYKIQPLDDIGLDDIDFIKMDAEGYEPLIIKGAMQTILRNRPVILYECKDHPKRYGDYHKDSVLEMLEPHGYKLVKKVGRGLKNAIIEFKG